MSQPENAVPSSSKDIPSRRKGSRMSDSEKQMAAVARKRITHKEIKVFVRNPLKDMMIDVCDQEGITQAQFVEKLIENELIARGLLK
ncbi:TPA: replication regulatory protein RepA [Klebsiella pneumoniae subsp. pneumoniae]|uniref:replication regulatory protein RepA n=1 Tax=Phytobacter diazotrophicus TaxID=395631 RepID=UPI000CD0A89F|nr:replication regulatory protein RepA [Phytobacter diazotrophicus]AUV04992.1 replication protein [Enterobacteriaceae bacterium ENNIH2]RDT52188.1 replication protein [Escherichia coli]HAU8265919.1 replication regulatory protein RepA [Kluyvera intermedia]HDT2444671.1 replication regulatory protein RepA [Klebsiella pneumoniae subsp. pneumoniae]MDV2903565.1 replication regulatory protein RepA [Phytobacter diazotrophicus]